MKTVNIHASCVAIGHKGVLILGDSGAGKSDLALRLIDDGARLVAMIAPNFTSRMAAFAPVRPNPSQD